MRCYPPNSALLRLRKCGAALALLGCGSLLPSFLSAATSTTPPVGYVKTTLLANSDTFIGTSLTRPPAYVGTVVSAAGTGISVSGDPQWELGAFTYVQGVQPNTYYVRLGAAPEGETNPFEGRTFKVEAGGASGLIVTDPLNGDLSTVPAGTKIEVIPYWTLGTLFPPEDEGVTFEESPSALARKTLIILPNAEGEGVNLSSVATYYFTSSQWRKVGGGTTDFGDLIMFENNNPIILRNNNNGAQDRYFYLNGSVLEGKSVIIVKSKNGIEQDNVYTLLSPVPKTLNELGLIASSSFLASSSPLSIKDRLLIFSNDSVSINKSSVATYYYLGNGAGEWRKVGGGSVDYGNELVYPNVKIVLRKVKSDADEKLLWEFK